MYSLKYSSYCKKCGTLNGCITYIIDMRLKNIAVSQGNYETLRNLGKLGMSFNDIISDLIMTKLHSMEYSHLSDNFKKIWSEERPRNHAQTVTPSPSNSGI